MKLRKSFAYALLPSVIAVSSANGQTYIDKANNATSMNNTAAWVGNVIPTGSGVNAAIARFNNTITTAANGSTILVGGSVNPLGLKIVDPTTTAGLLTFSMLNSSARVLTLGANATANQLLVDMSTATVNVAIGATTDTTSGTYRPQGSGALTHDIAVNRTLTIQTPTISNVTAAGFTTSGAGGAKYLNFTGLGSAVINSGFSVIPTAVNLIPASATVGLYMGLKVDGAAVTLNGSNKWVPTLVNHFDSSALTTANMAFELKTGSLAIGNNDALTVDSRLSAASALPFSFKGGSFSASVADRTISTAGGFGLDGSTTFTGSNSLTLNSKTVQATSSTVTNSNVAVGKVLSFGNVELSNSVANRILTIAGAGTTEITGIISNGGGSTASGITKDGAGILTLSGDNSYNGTTTINAGTLKLNRDGGALADTGAVVLANFSGALLDLQHHETIGSLAGGGTTGGEVQLNNRNLTVGDANNTTFGGVISGSGTSQLIKQGAGTLTLSGTNTYTGTATINTGVLRLGDGNLTGSLTGTTGITNDANLTVNRSNAFTQATDLNGQAIGGSGSFTQAGTGTTTLSLANGYTGATTVTAGTLELANATAAGTSAGGIAISGASAATLQINSGITTGDSITYSNTNAASSVNRVVAASGTYTTGTSGTLTSSFTGGQVDTTAQILAGTNSSLSDATLTMSFSGTSDATNDGARRSDVFTVNGTTGSDLYVLQLTASGLVADSLLGYHNGTIWDLAVTGNGGTNNATFAQQNYAGAFSAFQAFYGSTLSDYQGAYGIDTSTNSLWAVVNYGGSFAAVPEPTSALAGLLITAGLLRRRRK